MRLLTVVLAVTALAVVLGATATSGRSASQAVAVRSCTPINPWMAIQLVGNREAVYFNNFRSGPFPPRKAAIAVWSLGGPASAGGTAIHGWITSAKSGFSTRCSTVRAALKPPSLAGLGPVTRVKDGWFTGRKHTCDWRGRVLIEERTIPGGNRIVVRTQKGGSVLAVGEVAKGGGWLRGSKRCISAER